MITSTKTFIKLHLITAVDRRGEDTIIVFFGDHLPTMGLTDADMKSGDIFKTKYITWNNMGLAKKDADLTAYQLLAHITDQAGIHEGTMFRYHQTQTASETYLSGLEDLQTLRKCAARFYSLHCSSAENTIIFVKQIFNCFTHHNS